MDVLKFGYKYYKRHIPLALIALLTGFIVITIGLLFPQLVQIVIDFVIIPTDVTIIEQGKLASTQGNIFAFLINGRYGEIATIELMLNIAKLSVLLMAVKHILLYFRNNLFYVYGFKFDTDLRMLCFNKLMSQSNQVLSRYNTGDLLTTLNTDVWNLRTLFLHTIPNTIDSIFMITLSIIFLVRINPYLAILPFSVLPVQIYIFIKYIKNAKKINTNIRQAAADLSMNVQENINGVRLVRSFAAEEFEIKKFDNKNKIFKETYFKQVNFSTKYGFAFNAIRHILYLGCIALGSTLAIKGSIGIGAFTAFIAYVFAILDGTTQIINYSFEMQYMIVCGERIYTFVKTGNIINSPEKPRAITGDPNLSVKDLTLIIDEHTILKNINIELPYGKKLGIMGSTGSGKTSLIKLLTRFNDPVKGSIFINGVNLKDMALEEVRRLYSYVFQDVFLFSNTIDANIAFYNPKASHETVKHCAELACADGFIQRLNAGYNTIVGERGIGLSGGQKQRISIARALLKDAPILLLDDVTSALDSETEKQLLQNIYKKYQDKSIVISAHRASSVMDCDEIIILKDGEIAERGTHQELLSIGGIYYSTFTEQSAANIGG